MSSINTRNYSLLQQIWHRDTNNSDELVKTCFSFAAMSLTEQDQFFFLVYMKEVPFETLPRKVKVKYMRWRAKHIANLKLHNTEDYNIDAESVDVLREQMFIDMSAAQTKNKERK